MKFQKCLSQYLNGDERELNEINPTIFYVN